MGSVHKICIVLDLIGLRRFRAGIKTISFLSSLTRITPILANSIFHLFLQSNLTVKEMEKFIKGQDKRDMLEIIVPPDTAERYRGSKDRRCTCHSTGDSGFSSSLQPDDLEERTRIFDGRRDFLLSPDYENASKFCFVFSRRLWDQNIMWVHSSLASSTEPSSFQESSLL